MKHCTCTNVIALGLSIVLFWTSEPIGAAEVIVPDEMKNSTIQVSTGMPPQPYKDEWRRSCPDFLVFHPAPDGNPRWEDDDFCVLSERFIVVPMEEKGLLATWTAHGPRLAFSRIMVARSENGGQSWGTPSRDRGWSRLLGTVVCSGCEPPGPRLPVLLHLSAWCGQIRRGQADLSDIR